MKPFWRTLIAGVVCAVFVGGNPAWLGAAARTKTETFDRDPKWDGHNNRPTVEPRTVRQDFGYSRTSHAGGKPGEIGGFISPAGEPAYYALPIPTATFDTKLSASGTFACPDGQYHILVGFFNADTINEWRTPNTIVLRLNGRGDRFLAYLEYLTSKWRIGSIGGHGFKGVAVPKEGEVESAGFRCGGVVHTWSLEYDPAANDGKGVIKATIDDYTSVCEIDPAYRADGATFNRFGILNVIKSADTGGEVWFDNITVNGKSFTFDQDPKWEGRNNRRTYQTQMVRPRFDFGYSPRTNIAGGKRPGEMGGLIFRGDCRYPDRMAYYGDRIGPITLDKPFRASGKVAFTRGVSDSGATIGFFNSKTSMEVSDRQDSGMPKSTVGVTIEGPSSEGFFFYPCYRVNGDGQGSAGRAQPPLQIYPNGKSHDWSLEYDPDGADGRGRITVTLDGRSVTCDLAEGHKQIGATFDRFGIITSWIDGNATNVYFDDLTYTVSQ
ncbi:hypothetical protein [Fontivita pretiosa]|uniref:hypothetical protein n=1 Tax=Fontivita pretiosa TaxID=2989684 RepID=UPI003D17B42F